MAHYVIGDVQGCFNALQLLLKKIQFNPQHDQLWFAGDLVARGPDSLATLRLIMSFGEAANSVLGNHDLHLLAVLEGLVPIKKNDKTERILQAEDRENIKQWLRARPLCLWHEEYQTVVTHAGIPPFWSIKQTRQYAAEVEQALQQDNYQDYLSAMYGNSPALFSKTLKGFDRLRVITNYLTRMRLLHADYSLDFVYKEELATVPVGLTPWFQVSNPNLTNEKVIFGHWAALGGETGNTQFIAVDTACVWGGRLCAYRLEDGEKFYSQEPE